MHICRRFCRAKRNDSVLSPVLNGKKKRGGICICGACIVIDRIQDQHPIDIHQLRKAASPPGLDGNEIAEAKPFRLWNRHFWSHTHGRTSAVKEDDYDKVDAEKWWQIGCGRSCSCGRCCPTEKLPDETRRNFPLLNNGEPGKVSPCFVRQLLGRAAPSTDAAPFAHCLPPLLCTHLITAIIFDRRSKSIPLTKVPRQLMNVDGMLMLDAIDDDVSTTYAYTSPFLFAIQNRRQDTIISFRPAKPATCMRNAVISSLVDSSPPPPSPPYQARSCTQGLTYEAKGQQNAQELGCQSQCCNNAARVYPHH